MGGDKEGSRRSKIEFAVTNSSVDHKSCEGKMGQSRLSPLFFSQGGADSVRNAQLALHREIPSIHTEKYLAAG